MLFSMVGIPHRAVLKHRSSGLKPKGFLRFGGMALVLAMGWVGLTSIKMTAAANPEETINLAQSIMSGDFWKGDDAEKRITVQITKPQPMQVSPFNAAAIAKANMAQFSAPTDY